MTKERMLEVGDDIGAYRVVSTLESDLIQRVRARHRQLDRDYSLSAYPPLTQRPGAYEVFLTSLKLHSRLQHPNLETLFDAFELEGRFYLVHELLDGQALSFKRCYDREFGPTEVHRLLREGAMALGTYHKESARYLISDPEQIFVTADGHFKLRFHINQNPLPPPDPHQNQIGAIIGNPNFLSPEEAYGRNTDARTDLYRLAAHAYLMLTASPPFRGKDVMEVMQKVVRGPLLFREVAPHTNPALLQIITRAMAKEANHRFQNAEELLEVLDQNPATIDEPNLEDGEESLAQRFAHSGPFSAAEQLYLSLNILLALQDLGTPHGHLTAHHVRLHKDGSLRLRPATIKERFDLQYKPELSPLHQDLADLAQLLIESTQRRSTTPAGQAPGHNQALHQLKERLQGKPRRFESIQEALIATRDASKPPPPHSWFQRWFSK